MFLLPWQWTPFRRYHHPNTRCIENPWSIYKGSWNVLCVVLKMQIHPRLSHFWHFPSLCSLFCRETMQCGPICHNKNTSIRLAIKMDHRFTLIRHHRHVFTSRLVIYEFWYLVHLNRHVLQHSLISIISKAVIKYSYDVGKLSSKIMTIQFLARVLPNTRVNLQVLWSCCYDPLSACLSAWL